MPRFFNVNTTTKSSSSMKPVYSSYASSTASSNGIDKTKIVKGETSTVQNFGGNGLEFQESDFNSSTKKNHIVKRSPLGKKTSKRKVKKRFFPKDVSNKAVTRTSPNMMNKSPQNIRSEQLNIPAQDPSPKVKAPAYQDSSYNSSLHIKQEDTKSYQRFRNPYSSYDCSQPKDDSLAPYLPLSFLSRVIAIDSRTTSSFLGDASSKSYLNACIHFLRLAARRGVLPSLLSTSSPRITYSSKGVDEHSQMVQVEAKNLHMHCLTGNHASWNNLLAPVVLSINEELDVHVKKRQTKWTEEKDDMALTTWKHFADMGEYTFISALILSKNQ